MSQSVRNAWNKLIQHACDENAKPDEFNVSLQLEISDERWNAYAAFVSCRQITFYCDKGSATYDVNTVGYRTGAVLVDWERDDEGGAK